MATELVGVGGVLVVVAGVVIFFLLRRQKTAESPHFR